MVTHLCGTKDLLSKPMCHRKPMGHHKRISISVAKKSSKKKTNPTKGRFDALREDEVGWPLLEGNLP